LVALLVGDHEVAAAGGMNDFARQVQQLRATRLESRPVVTWATLSLEPRHQIKDQLAHQQIRPVGMELLLGSLSNPKPLL
jgi:hypothetical protein